MPMREVKDAHGRDWIVWDTHPESPDVRDEFSQGWLSFRNREDTRRLAPPPEGWFTLPDEALMALLEGASPAGPRRTRI